MSAPGLSCPLSVPWASGARHCASDVLGLDLHSSRDCRDEHAWPTTPASSDFELEREVKTVEDADENGAPSGVSFVILRPRPLDGEDDCESEPATPRPLAELLDAGSATEDKSCSNNTVDRGAQNNPFRTGTVGALPGNGSSDDGETVTQRGQGLLARAAAALCARFPVPSVGFTSGGASQSESSGAELQAQGEGECKSDAGPSSASFVSRGIPHAVPAPTPTTAPRTATVHPPASALPRPTAPPAKSATRTIAADSSPAFVRRRAKIAALERAQAEEDARDVAALCADVRTGGGARCAACVRDGRGQCTCRTPVSAMSDRTTTHAGGLSASGVWSSGGHTGVRVHVELQTATTTRSAPSLHPVALAETFAHVRFAPTDLDGLGARWRECAELRAWAAQARRRIVEKEWAGVVQAQKERDVVLEREEKVRLVALEREQEAAQMRTQGAEVSAPPGVNEGRTPLPVIPREGTADGADTRGRGNSAVAAEQPACENSSADENNINGAKIQELLRANDDGDETFDFPAPPPMARTAQLMSLPLPLPFPLPVTERAPTRGRTPATRDDSNGDDGDGTREREREVSLPPAMRRTHAVGRYMPVGPGPIVPSMQTHRGRALPCAVRIRVDRTKTQEVETDVREDHGEGMRVVRRAPTVRPSADASGYEEDGRVEDVAKDGVRADADEDEEEGRARERELLAQVARRGMGARTRTMVRVPAVPHAEVELREDAAAAADVGVRRTRPTAVLDAPGDTDTAAADALSTAVSTNAKTDTDTDAPGRTGTTDAHHAAPPLPTRSPARMRANIALPRAPTDTLACQWRTARRVLLAM